VNRQGQSQSEWQSISSRANAANERRKIICFPHWKSSRVCSAKK